MDRKGVLYDFQTILRPNSKGIYKDTKSRFGYRTLIWILYLSLDLEYYHLEMLCLSLLVSQGRMQEHRKILCYCIIIYSVIMYILYIAHNIHAYWWRLEKIWGLEIRSPSSPWRQCQSSKFLSGFFVLSIISSLHKPCFLYWGLHFFYFIYYFMPFL